ncbi:hypothetical protein D3C78_1569540 [compost metagenome]
MLVDQFAHRGAHPLVEPRAVGLEEIGEGRLMAIGVVQQRADFTDVGAVEQVDFGAGLGHGDDSCSGYFPSSEH